MPIQLADKTVIEADKDVFSCELAGGQALLDIRSSTYYSINEVGAHVWTQLQSPTSFAEVQSSVLETFEVEAERARRDLTALINQFADAGLIRVAND